MSSLSSSELETKLREAGIKLLELTSCVTTQVQELLHILDELEGLLSKVEQAPSSPMKDALYPSMKALISSQLLKHTDIDVKVSVASCMSELTRITAPDAPYDDVQMKDIFQLTVTAFNMLSSKDTRGYSKALHILENIVKVKACLLMLDLECDGLIADMFKQFLSAIRYIPLPVVFRQMEYIMTLTLEESEEISEEVLSSLLSSVSKTNENVLSRSWRLGENVLRNCAAKVQRFLPKVVRSRNLSFKDYSVVVASICHNSPEDEHVAAVETHPSATQPSETIMDDGTGQKIKYGTLKGGTLSRTLENGHPVKQQVNAEARRHLQTGNSDVTGTVQVKAATVPKKRGRKPKSQQKPEESGLRREERVSDSSIMPLRPLHMDLNKKEHDDSKENIEKDLGIPHGIDVFGEKLVGRRIKVWWPLDEMFYEGAVASFDSLTQTHKVLYADGDEETLNLRNERWSLLKEHSSLAAASAKPLKKKAKSKSASSGNQQGTLSSSKCRHRYVDKPKTGAPKSGNADNDFVPDAKVNDASKGYATFEDDKRKSNSETEDSKHDVIGNADVANGSITVNPSIVNVKDKFSSDEETKMPTITREPKPFSIVEPGGGCATHTYIYRE
ncbi:sister chromatid cohesion protein PDS5 homolog D-like isoform X1 [Apium graveolens]|uniref:sister chromatid cohesion protein PDS5 homolog D-like isoform X1 n=1 Tax=Apium graveolens TaxID=4045 RepID=UPI003D7A04D5